MGEVVQSLARLSSQGVSFVVCDYINTAFYGNLRSRHAPIRFATPVETMAAPRVKPMKELILYSISQASGRRVPVGGQFVYLHPIHVGNLFRQYIRNQPVR